MALSFIALFLLDATVLRFMLGAASPAVGRFG
jgi:hypothetical protein